MNRRMVLMATNITKITKNTKTHVNIHKFITHWTGAVGNCQKPTKGALTQRNFLPNTTLNINIDNLCTTTLASKVSPEFSMSIDLRGELSLFGFQAGKLLAPLIGALQ